MASPYDEIAYPGYPHAQTHPDRLAALGVLHGLDAAPPERCRVLEIGCGNGGNLVPMAYALPDATLVGIDIAATAIDEGRALARELALGNLRLLEVDLAEATSELGEFDYVVAHGVYSWIPAAARDRLMTLCREVLAPHGVAYISYNVMPGGHVRQMLREMLLFHVRDMEEPQERIDQARAFAEFVSSGGANPALEEEVARLRRAPDWLLFHDDLAEVNDPVSLRQFAQHASDFGLQFLAEADFFDMDILRFAPEIRDTLRQMEGEEVLLKEQYLDFLTFRRFRQTLLCREEAAVERPCAERIASLWVACRAQPISGEVMALRNLADRWPETVPARECGVEPEHLLQLYGSGVVELHAMASKFSTAISERPRASLVARQQARRGTVVANLRHEPVDLENEGACRLLDLLDGAHSCADIQAWLGADPRPALERFARLALLEA